MKSLAQLGNELYSGRTSIPFVAKARGQALADAQPGAAQGSASF